MLLCLPSPQIVTEQFLIGSGPWPPRGPSPHCNDWLGRPASLRLMHSPGLLASFVTERERRENDQRVALVSVCPDGDYAQKGVSVMESLARGWSGVWPRVAEASAGLSPLQLASPWVGRLASNPQPTHRPSITQTSNITSFSVCLPVQQYLISERARQASGPLPNPYNNPEK